MVNVKWLDSVRKPGVLYFDDLDVNTAFVNVGPRSRGAVYIKVYDGRNDEYHAMEVATGHLWEPTESPVKVVEVNIDISVVKPDLY